MIYRAAPGTIMTPDVLSKYIGEHKAEVGKRLKKLDCAYRGDYEIFHQHRKPAWKPDNRIAFGFAKYIVDTMNGYFTGIPVRVSHQDKATSEYLDFLKQYNGLDDVNAELGKLCDTFGAGNEIYYLDEDSKPCVQQVSPMESFMIYDDSILEKPVFFVRYFRDANNVERGSWSDAFTVQHFVRRSSYFWEGEPFEHHFDDVPATEFVENVERLGLLDGVMSAINAFNKAISEKANDVDAFADAYLKILGVALDNKDLQFIRDNRIINIQDEGDRIEADFLQKPSSDETQENLLDRLYKGIFQMSMVADLSDTSFSGNASGVALKFKLQAMSNLADSKKRKFEAALNRRYRILFSHKNLPMTLARDGWIGIDYRFTKNLPANVLEESQIAGNLSGITSEETQLSVLSVVDNVKEELTRKKEEQDALAYQTDYPTGRTSGELDAVVPKIEEAAEVQGKQLNGAQTQSLIAIMAQFTAGGLTEGQAINLIATAIGISKTEARAILNGDVQ